MWLRHLMADGLIPPGKIDGRSILDVRPRDLQGFVQCHFFAGVGGWSYALRLAGWPDARPVWTGSCPCQPFSSSGKHLGTADLRHLWPQFARLISVCKPADVIGEQVASKAGRVWLAGVRADLEAMGYAVGASDLCSAGVGSPNIRQRLYWMGHSTGLGRNLGDDHDDASFRPAEPAGTGGTSGGLDNAEKLRCQDGPRILGEHDRQEPVDGRITGGLEHPSGDGRIERRPESGGRGAVERREPCGVADPSFAGLERGNEDGERAEGFASVESRRPSRGLADTLGERGCSGPAGIEDAGDARQPGETRRPDGPGFWDAYDLIPCRDGKARRVEPGTFPLAHGVPGRVGLLRGYGNAINPVLAAEFIKAVQETLLIL